MKKFKNVMIAALSGVMLFSCCSFLATDVNAADTTSASNKDNPYLISYPRNEFEFSPQEMLYVYALNGDSTSNNDFQVRHRMEMAGKNAILVRTYDEDGNLVTDSEKTDKWSNGIIDANDASNMFTFGIHDNELYDFPEKTYPKLVNEIQYSIAKASNISKDDVTVESKAIYQKIEGVNDKELTTIISSTTGPTLDNISNVKTYVKLDRDVYIKKYKEINSDDKTDREITKQFDEDHSRPSQMTVEVSAATKSGAEYRLVLGTDNKFYLLNTKEPDNSVFGTTLEYSSKEEGKIEDDTYYSLYYNDEDKNAKKDLDVTAHIKSTTKEGIVKTNGVALTEDGKPNSQGWYYPDKNNKTEIAKLYKFDDYDNTKDNGKVSEKVELVGENGGESKQTPSIKWTFRRINIDEKDNSDGSVTIIITYNLPIDEKSVPSDWKVIYDKDGKTAHKITKTIKKGEDYDKDVIVKQNGTDATVTTHVTKKWKKDKSQAPNLGPQAGVFSVVLIVIIAGVAVFAITRYRKLNK